MYACVRACVHACTCWVYVLAYVATERDTYHTIIIVAGVAEGNIAHVMLDVPGLSVHTRVPRHARRPQRNKKHMHTTNALRYARVWRR